MSQVHDTIVRTRRKVFQNHFLREVSYMFTIEASPLFESKLQELGEFAKSYGFAKQKQIGSEGSFGLLTRKGGIDVLISTRLLLIKVDAAEYKNYDIFKEFLLPFVTDYAKKLNLETIESAIILKNNDFVLKRENELLRQLSEEQYIKSLFSSKYLAAYQPKGVFERARGLNVSSRYSVTSTERELKIELAISAFELETFKLEELEARVNNANNALFDMWSYTLSKNVKNKLFVQKEE